MAPRRQPPPRGEVGGRLLSGRRAVWVGLLMAAVVLALFARRSYSLWARQAADSRLRIGAISEARRYLELAARSTPGDGEIDIMLAFCHRQLRQVDRWREALAAAERKGVPPSRIEREAQLYRIQTGNWHEGAESQLASPAGQGVTEYDVPSAAVAGCLAGGRHGLAKQLLDGWGADRPNDPHVAYMRGRYWESLGDTRQARSQHEAAISLESRHEPARLALAATYEDDDQLHRAFRQYAALGSVSPASRPAALGAAKVLRRLGRLERAQAILEPLVRTTEPATDAAVELGRIAMDRGDFSSAERWFERAGVERTADPRVLISAVRLFGMQGKSAEAERLFQRVAAVGDHVTRVRDLRVRLTVDPGDAATAAEIERLLEDLDAEMTSLKTPPRRPPAEDEDAPPGQRLYALHCSACHGPEGDGDGRAARHLFPPPRDLRWEPSRLVGTTNGVPTLDDTQGVLRRGIPGTSMASYDDLDDDELRLLAEETHRLRREGLRRRLASLLETEDDEVDESELEESVRLLTTPGEAIGVPPIGPAAPASVARGKETYLELGCATCHGEDGRGAVMETWYDERGFPVRARDLAGEELKGGRDAGAVYLRVAAGMPGTQHPSAIGVSEQQLTDVVQFCLSLSREPKKILTDHQRAALADGRDYLDSLEAE